jgi:hypothetical protein
MDPAFTFGFFCGFAAAVTLAGVIIVFFHQLKKDWE